MTQESINLYAKLAGSALTGIGSIVLAWRIKQIVKWVALALSAHEISIDVLMKRMNGQQQQFPVVQGVVKHLNDIENTLGTKLLIAGFGCLGVGMLLNVLSIALTL
jgi:hypothetical protein